MYKCTICNSANVTIERKMDGMAYCNICGNNESTKDFFDYAKSFTLKPKRTISLDTYLVMQNQALIKGSMDYFYGKQDAISEAKNMVDALLKHNNVEVEGGL